MIEAAGFADSRRHRRVRRELSDAPVVKITRWRSEPPAEFCHHERRRARLGFRRRIEEDTAEVVARPGRHRLEVPRESNIRRLRPWVLHREHAAAYPASGVRGRVPRAVASSTFSRLYGWRAYQSQGGRNPRTWRSTPVRQRDRRPNVRVQPA